MKFFVSWEDQWAQFAQGFRDGKAHIDLKPFGGTSTLRLVPGPGFGDLSHPTTYVMLELMQGRIKGKNILDIGCGSGILTLAALLLGATTATGIDIDPDALTHAHENAQLNHLTAFFSKDLPSSGEIVLMNMILPEQKIVMQQRPKGELWIVSGILPQQQETYLGLAKAWNWNLVQKKEREGWLGMVFKGSHSQC